MSSQPTAYPYPSTLSANIPGVLTVNDSVRFVMPFAGRLASAKLAVSAAPTGAALVASIFNTGQAGAGTTSMGTATMAVSTFKADVTVSSTEAYTAFAAGDILQVKVTTVGSTVAGANLFATLVVDQYNLDGAGSNEYSLTFRRGAHDGGVLTAINTSTYQNNGSSSSITLGSSSTTGNAI